MTEVENNTEGNGDTGVEFSPEDMFSFDGVEGEVKVTGKPVCGDCGVKRHKHEKKRVYPDDGPTGSYHYNYICP